jgi:exonuclease III
VITANLEEAYGRDAHSGDMARMNELPVFAERAQATVPYAPDVVLLQEVRAKSARRAAEVLTSKFRQKFVVAVMPGDHPTTDYPNKQIHKETSILLNTVTMKQSSRGGFIKNTYSRSVATGGKVAIHKQAQVLATQRSSGKTFALTSLHYARVRDFKTRQASNKARAAWSRQIVSTMHRKYPNADVTHIGGDFNTIRCFSGAFASCKEAAFWKYMHSAGFLDTLWFAPADTFSGILKFTGVDYIFSTARPLDGGQDERGGYSDHKMRWVRLAS